MHHPSTMKHQPFLRLFFALTLLGSASACTEDAAQEPTARCTTGEQRCSCYPNDTCNAGLTCVAGSCQLTGADMSSKAEDMERQDQGSQDQGGQDMAPQDMGERQEDMFKPADMDEQDMKTPPDMGPSCAAPLQLCAAACVDIQQDEAHCGGCDKACDPNAQCEQGQCLAPGSPTGLTIKYDHTCITRRDGGVVCWGRNDSSQLSLLGAMPVISSPYALPSPATAVTLATGKRHTCALLPAGEVWCWGNNAHKQLGRATNDRANTWTPSAAANVSTAVAVDAGASSTCAVLNNGVVQCWGDGTFGQLGQNNLDDYPQPTSLSAINDAVSIAAGEHHYCALRQDKTLMCWGYASSGQLGIANAPVTIKAPTRVEGLSGVLKISANIYNTCALLEDKSVKCWGDNDSGQIGDGTQTMRKTPTAVAGLSDVLDIAVGASHTCAAHSDGTVSCWGGNSAGQLGDGTTANRAMPAKVMGLSQVVKVAAGADHSCALTADGKLYCWGSNTYGQLGDGTTTSRATPTLITLP